jgi:hypothetical protein
MQAPAPSEVAHFQIVCRNCDGLGIIFEFPEDAPSSAVITCRHCGAPRGTLGNLRRLSTLAKQDLFEI